ncbi:MAG: protein translocase subunit SecD [Ignavibacteriae bacterium]|nr:protein translocase subunit SecD [Ignavibacteriota bacterium]
MRKYAFRISIVAAALLIGIYYLWPTYVDYRFQQQLKSLTGADSLKFYEEHEADIRENRARRIKLGLDLQGGMRVVLEVNTLKLIEDLAKNKDEQFTQLAQEVRNELLTSEETPVAIMKRKFDERGIRMGKYYRSIRETNDEVASYLEDESKKAIDRAIEIVRNRVDQYGVSEPSIQKLGGTRIIVELPGVSNEQEVRDLVGKTALLEFKLLKEPEQVQRALMEIDRIIAGKTDTTAADTTKALSDTTARAHPFTSLLTGLGGDIAVSSENIDRVKRLLARDDVKRGMPPDMQVLFGAKSTIVQGVAYTPIYCVKAQAELEGGVVVNAKASIDPNTAGHVVDMEMNNEGSKDWARITGANIKKRIAIVMDNAVFSAPVVQQKIIGGRSQISGMSNLDEARLIEIVLKAGALPAPVEIAEQRSVGPSLGEDSIRSGLFSSGLATLLTILFMIIYYRTGGAVADVAVVFCLILLLAVLAAFQGTLTLPGIAGIILTLAVAVDANVLIYERVREEQATGKTLRAAIDAGYEKAFTAIFDSNLTTFITGVILFQFGTGPVQGFALTLMIGIAASMFTAIFITRIIFNVMTDKSGAKVSFG